MKIDVKWYGQMAFSASAPSGHKVKMDAAPDLGGGNAGMRPTELLLSALGGCTGINIISILKKMRLNPTSFHMEIEGIRANERPKRFTELFVHYYFEGDLPEDKVERAIVLTNEKYCSVAHSLNAKISSTFSINGIKSGKIL